MDTQNVKFMAHESAFGVRRIEFNFDLELVMEMVSLGYIFQVVCTGSNGVSEIDNNRFSLVSTGNSELGERVQAKYVKLYMQKM